MKNQFDRSDRAKAFTYAGNHTTIADVKPFNIDGELVPMSIAWRNAMRAEYRKARRRTNRASQLGTVMARQAVDRLIMSVIRVPR